MLNITILKYTFLIKKINKVVVWKVGICKRLKGTDVKKHELQLKIINVQTQESTHYNIVTSPMRCIHKSFLKRFFPHDRVPPKVR